MWVPHDTRDAVMDFTSDWSRKTEISTACFIRWLQIGSSKFYAWRKRYGKVNEHNGRIPRDFWTEPWEREAIVQFFEEHPDEGYRRLAFMMLDEDVVAVSPTTVWRVLNQAGLLHRWNEKRKKGTGFQQPLKPYGQFIQPNSKGPFYRGFLRFPAANLGRLISRLIPP